MTTIPSLLLALLTLFSLGCHATTLTYVLQSHEKACFYAFASKVGQKISFYFAVQSGGNFDIDFTIIGPANTLIQSGTKERQADHVFAAPSVGEYSFCFSNGVASYDEKFIDFDIAVKDDEFSIKAELPEQKPADLEHLSPLQNSIYNIGASLSTVARLQKYFRTRENRNFDTVKSTISRIYWFSFMESVLIVTIAALQVYIVRTFFKTTRGKI